jgi:phosphoglycerate kinase
MRSKLKRLHDLPDVRGRYVIVRAGLNVPVADGKVTNQFRIVRALPTLNKLRQAGARIILMGHLGRNPEDSLYPVYEVLQTHVPVRWAGALTGDAVTEARASLEDGEVLLLENVRQHPGETENDPALADALASLGEYFVNDAFADSHRMHASIAGIASRLPTYFGLNFMHEYDELTKAREPEDPALFLLGGAKFETKLPLVELFLPHYEHVFIGGALANDIFKARGYEIGTSLVSDIDLTGSPLLTNEKILVPVDVEVEGPQGRRTCPSDAVAPDERILDAGPATVELLARHVTSAKTILWNGPLGNFEAGFDAQTKALAKVIADAPGYAIIGGGDTIAAIEALGCQECFTFMSTAGGAMLTFLETGTLAGIDAALGRS